MRITLKDGSVKEYEGSRSALDIAKDISEGLARAATSAKVNGDIVDLRKEISEDCELELLTFDSEDGKGAFWHTTSHIMAQAVKRLYPETLKCLLKLVKLCPDLSWQRRILLLVAHLNEHLDIFILRIQCIDGFCKLLKLL